MLRASRRSLPRCTAIAALVLGLVVAASPAIAQPKTKDSDRAFILYEQGRTAYKEGRYSDAIAFLRESQRLKPEPILNFNLAKAYEGAGSLDEAVASYESYLATATDAPDRGDIEKKVAELKAAIAANAAAKAKAEAQPPAKAVVVAPASVPDASPSPVPWIIGGVGAAGLVVGGVLGGVAAGKNDGVGSAASQVEGADLRSSAEGLALGANVSFGVGGAVLLAGVIWGIVDLATLGPAAAAPTTPAATGRFVVRPTASGLRVEF